MLVEEDADHQKTSGNAKTNFDLYKPICKHKLSTTLVYQTKNYSKGQNGKIRIPGGIFELS